MMGDNMRERGGHGVVVVVMLVSQVSRSGCSYSLDSTFSLSRSVFYDVLSLALDRSTRQQPCALSRDTTHVMMWSIVSGH